MLLAGIVMLVARTPVEQKSPSRGSRAAEIVGGRVAAEILFVPVLLLTVIALTVSIIGIPSCWLCPRRFGSVGRA